MWDLFKYTLDFLVAKSPLFLAFVAVIAATVYITKYVQSHNSKHKSLDDFKHDKCNKHSEEIVAVKEDVKQHNDAVRLVSDLKLVTDKLSRSVNTIETWVMKSDPSMIDSMMKKNSPYKLTPLGLHFLKISGGKDCLDQNKVFFLDKLKSTNPNTEYDVELNAKSVLFSNFNEAVFNDIKKFLYYSPDEDIFIDENGAEIKFKITMPVLLNVMSVYLRDLYLKDYPFEDS